MNKKTMVWLLVASLLFSTIMVSLSLPTQAADDPDPNLARGKTVTASSSLEAAAGWGLAKATDGIRGNGTKSYGWTSDSDLTSNHKEWITIDLGAATRIGRVDLYPREISPGVAYDSFPIDMNIQVSVDGATWMTVREINGYGQPGMEAQRFSFQPVDARYVKIEGTSLRFAVSESKYRMQLSEVEVYRTPAPDKPVNGIHESGELKVQVHHASGTPVDVSFYRRNTVPVADLTSSGSTGFDNKTASGVPSGNGQGAGDTAFSSSAIAGMAAPDGDYYTTQALNAPYQRYDLHINEDISGLSELNVTWKGKTDQVTTLYAWDYISGAWTALNARTGDGQSDFIVKGKLVPARMVKDQTAKLMVGLSQKNVTEPGKLPGESEYDFSFVWMTDTQYYSKNYPAIYDTMSQWIVDNQSAKKIQYVLHTGDIVDSWNDEVQWQRANASMKILDDASVPYGVVSGNHDVNHEANEYVNYWRYFGRDRYEGKPWYGGDKDNNRHHYDLISAGGMDFVILYLGVYGTIDTDTVTWANQVLQQYKDRYAIVGTHAYIDPSGKYGVNGKDIMEKIVAPNENVFLTVSGHYHGAFYNVKRINGRVVYEVLSDYQGGPLGGQGYLRLLQFDAASKRMYMNTYSPYMNDYNFFEDRLEQATFPLNLAKGEIALATDYIGIHKIETVPIGTVQAVPGNSTATIPIQGIGDNQDGWYASATDASGNSAASAVFPFDPGSMPDDRVPPATSVQLMPYYQTPVFTPPPFEPVGPWTNFAKSRKVLASSDVAKWGWSKEAAVDGSRDSINAMGWTSYNDIKNNHTEWITVDMGNVRDINLVELYPRNDAGNLGVGFPKDFTIQVSKDNANWTTVVEETGYHQPTGGESFSFPRTAARFVKITGTDLRQDSNHNYHMQLAEIEIYGREAGAPQNPPSTGSSPLWHGWFSPVRATLTAADAMSGLAGIQVSRDNGATWSPYTGSLMISEEGVNPIWYRSVDQSGNIEPPKKLDVKIDRTAPVTVSQPSGGSWSNQDEWVHLTATDNLSGAETRYSLDGGATWVYYSIPFPVEEEGISRIQYQAIDNAGNIEPIRTLDVKIDRTVPEIQVKLDQYELWPANHKMVTVHASVYASDALSGIASWQLTSIASNEPDNGTDDGDTTDDIQNAAFGTPDTVFDLRAERSGQGNGRVYTITYTATDLAGNTKQATVEVKVPLNRDGT
ncbi:discoidin domain-containing protein [Paenibacillus sp. HJGM_3]|uniref:discoidin domain-containing protein n=1 Tax=Paenibacillus sp. HJGM_3 TaxID=3379816 RepID=UPI00385E7FB7